MFGYIRPEKDELLVGEYNRYKSIYCGICKQIKKNFGNIPRTSLTYDITFFAVLYIALSEDNANTRFKFCMLNPLKKVPVLSGHKALEKAAVLSVLLAKKKAEDNVRDSSGILKRLKYKGADILLSPYFKTAVKKHPEESDIIQKGLCELYKAEINQDKQNYAPEVYADIFADILKELFVVGYRDLFEKEKNRDNLIQAMGLLGFNIGKWIYILDAADDYMKDRKKSEFNAFYNYEYNEMLEAAKKILVECEGETDRIAALLPYCKDAGIISNIVLKGMPSMRKTVLAGENPQRV